MDPGAGLAQRKGHHDPRLGALSAAVVRLVGDYGRTPASAISWQPDRSCVVTALADFMTVGERELVEGGDARLVREVRAAFAQAIEPEYLRAAEHALGCEVVAHRSDLICASNVCIEIFLLGSERHARADGT